MGVRETALRKLRKFAGVKFEKVNGTTTANVNGLRFGRIDKSHAAPILVEILRGDYHFACQGRAVVIDIGMNCGFASLCLASRDDVHAVYAFEPVPAAYEDALFSFRLNPKQAEKIHAFNFGLGDSNREVVIDFTESVSGWTTTIDNPPEWLVEKIQNQGSVKLPVQIKDAATEIGDIIKRHPNEKIMMKCDCEGGEKEIFARLDEAGLLSAIDIVVMEYHFGYSQFITPLLDKNGFVYFCHISDTEKGFVRAAKTMHGLSGA